MIRSVVFVGLMLVASYANEFVDLYRSNGVDAMVKRANELLGSSEYWREKIDGIDTRFGYFETPRKHLFIVNKSAYMFSFYDYQGGRLIHNGDYKATLGDAHGDKFVEGDLKTPVGTYKITSKLTTEGRLDKYYGPIAYTTNYPNHMDKKLKKTGHGIWVHGFPINGDRNKDNSEGCVVIDNNLLLEIDRQIQPENIAVMINEDGVLEASKEDLSHILALLFKWRWYWKNNDIENYLDLYSDDFVRSDGVKRSTFNAIKRQIFSRKEQKTIELADIEVLPYPNSIGETIFVARFWQDYKAKSHTSSRTKEIYIRKENGNYLIVLEH